MPRYPDGSSMVSSLSESVYFSRPARRVPERLYPLNVGDTYLDPPLVARAESQRCAEHPRLHNYAPVRGEPTLIDAIVEHHQGLVEREAVQIMAGATGGLAVVCAALLDPGDEVVILAPYWPLIRGMIAARGAVPVEVAFFDRLDQPGFDIEAVIDAAVTERTVALYVNSPNNPTGRALASSGIAAVARVARRHALWVLADEAYEALYFGAAEPPRVWQHEELRERTIAAHTFSKSFGLAGARVGYTHGPPAILPAIRGAQTFLTYCAPRPMQVGAARALREAGDWTAQARQLYAAAGREAAAALGVPMPAAGTFLFFDARPLLREGEDVVDLLDRCREAGVLLTPGASCGRDYSSWLRLCFTSVPPSELTEALARLRGVLGS